jgi:hypothetical protein
MRCNIFVISSPQTVAKQYTKTRSILPSASDVGPYAPHHNLQRVQQKTLGDPEMQLKHDLRARSERLAETGCN